MQKILERAIQIAVLAHNGQVDKGGRPYILHPISVMMKMDTIEEKIVAILHDSIEDSNIKKEELIAFGIPKRLVDEIDLLTRKNGDSYMQYISKVKTGKIAKKVKLADLETNMNLSRIKKPTKTDFDRVKKYKKAYKLLLGD